MTEAVVAQEHKRATENRRGNEILLIFSLPLVTKQKRGVPAQHAMFQEFGLKWGTVS